MNVGSGWVAGDVAVGGVRLHYHRTGGEGPPLVLLHGFTDAGLCWTRVARDLESEYDVVMPDARGHGRSARAAGTRDADSLVAGTVGLIRGLGLDRVALLGHSMGAATAAGIAGADPDLVACVVLEDPPWFDEPRVRAAGGWDYLRRFQTVEELTAYGRELHPTWEDVEIGPWAEAKHQFDRSLLDTPPVGGRPWREIAGGIRCPTLLLTADNDLGAIVTPGVAAEIARLAPARVEHIGGAGHNIRREQYDRYRAAVTEFLHHEYAPVGRGAGRGEG